MIKKSKIIYALALWFTYIGLTSAYATVAHFGEKGALWDAQSLLVSVVGLICAVGFFFHKKWALWTYLGALPFAVAMNFIWLKGNPPPHLFWGTTFLLSLIINAIPAFFMWIRRSRLATSADGATYA